MPAGRLVRFAETSWKDSQPPVAGTAADPSKVPVGEPARTSNVPPAAPEAVRAVSLVALVRRYGLNEIQSPFSM